MGHAYPMEQIVGWFQDGIIWWVLSPTPLRNLVTVPNTPPIWWYRWFSWGDWYYGSDDSWHPYPELAQKFLLGTWRIFSEHVDENEQALLDRAANALWGIIGMLPSWATSVANALVNLATRIGDGYTWWANNNTQAIQRLFDWLPNAIKYAGMPWDTWLDLFAVKALNWARQIYDDAKWWAYHWRDWFNQFGSQLGWWYIDTRDFVSSLRTNLASMILNALGATWTRLVAFDQDALSWVYNFKSLYAPDLSELFADPGAWVVERVRRELLRLW